MDEESNLHDMKDWHPDIPTLVHDAYRNAVDHGFHEGASDVNSQLAAIALIHSELGEATEAIRNVRRCEVDGVDVRGLSDESFVMSVKDTLEDELADTVIRIFDFCGDNGIDLESHIMRKMKYNTNRPYRHGKVA